MSVAALAFAATACDEKKEDLGAPSVEVEKSEISFEKTGGTETVQVTATRDWKATTEQDWISIGPREGKGSSKAVTVEIKVMENSGLDREGAVKFDIGFDSKTLVVKQKGTGSVASIVSGKTDASVTLKDVLVTGVTNKSAVVTDATGSILVFVNATPGVKVGDKVTVTGTTGKHNGLMQITEPKFQIASSGNTVTYPDPKTIDESNVSSYKSDVVEFVTFKGKVKKNDVYYNIFIGGVTDKDLSLSYFPGDMESFVDKEITVKGYFVGGGTHYQIVAVNVDGKDITEAVENGGGNPGGGDNPGGETPDEGKFASNVKWTLGENAYDGTSPDNTRQTATINGVKVVTILKLGTSKKPGKATLTIPANTSKLSFYAVAWKGKTATLVASSAGTEVGTQAVAGNVGATGNPEYTISVSDSDHYTMSLSPQASESNIEITTKENVRVILFGIVAE